MSQFRDLLQLRDLKQPERPSIKEGSLLRNVKNRIAKDLYATNMQKGFRHDIQVEPKKKGHRRGQSIGGITHYDSKREQMTPSPMLSMYAGNNSDIITPRGCRRMTSRAGPMLCRLLPEITFAENNLIPESP